MPMFQKKPVTVEAIKWTGNNLFEVITLTDGEPNIKGNFAGMQWEVFERKVAIEGLKIFTLEGKLRAEIGDWIIKGVKGECYPCKPDIFEMTYTLLWSATPTPAANPIACKVDESCGRDPEADPNSEWEDTFGPDYEDDSE